jgi:hypothetical protein
MTLIRRYFSSIYSLREIITERKMGEKQWEGLFFILITVVFFIILATFHSYGVTWDDPIRKRHGNNVILWYLSGFKYKASLDGLKAFYGSVFDFNAQIFANTFAFLTDSFLYEVRHLVNAMLGLFGIITIYRLGKLLSGSTMGGFFCALFLVLTPRFYGHMFNNPKDIPFAVLFLVSMYYILLSFKYMPKIPKSLMIKMGISIGLALGVRIGGYLLFGYLGLLGIIFSVYYRIGWREFFKLVGRCFIILLIAYVVMLIFWPFAQVNPIVNPFRALGSTVTFAWDSPLFYMGELINSGKIPWHYLPTWFSITLPEYYFVILPLGLLMSLLAVIRYKKYSSFVRNTIKFNEFALNGVTLFAFIFPILVVIIARSIVYDGLRHFLFDLLLLIALSGVIFTKFLKSLAPKVIKIAVSVLVIISMGLTVFDCIDLHPYQNIYFNRLVAGGLKKASESYPTDYWGGAYKEAAEWLKNYVEQNEEEYKDKKIGIVYDLMAYYSMEYLFNTEYYINKDKKLFDDVINKKKYSTRIKPNQTKNTDKRYLLTRRINRYRLKKYFYVINTRLVRHERFFKKGEIIYTVKRKDTPIVYVIKPHEKR